MAKRDTKKTTPEDRALTRNRELNAQLDRAQLEKAKAEQKCKELLEQEKKTTRLRAAAAARFDGVLSKLNNQAATPRKLSLDAASSTAAQSFNEGWNFIMRWLAESAEKKDPSAWTVENVDILQSVPNTIVGLAAYMIEMVTRPKFIKDKEGKDTEVPYLPTWGREFWSKAGEILFNLGFSNIARMARYRLAENVDERMEAKRVVKVSQAETEALKAEKQTLLAKIAELEAAKK